jgi:CelD/BcsL family acetyltransferase involved in cellulose biosynthesis
LVENTYCWKLGYHTVFRLSAPTIVVSFDGLVGNVDADDCVRVIAALRKQLRTGEAAAVLFQKVEVDSPLRRALDDSGWLALRANRPAVVRRTLSLPESWDAFLATRSSKSRRQLRYDDNKLRRKFGDRLELRRHTPDSPDPSVLHDMTLVAAKSYQRGMGVNDIDDAVSSALFELARERGWLRAWVLYIDGRPVAFWWGTVYAGTLSTGSPGYVPELARERVGYYTLRRMIEEACADPEIRQLDFGHGDADYKERFATSATMTADTTLFAVRPRSITLRLLAALVAGTATVTNVVAGTQLGHRAKRWMRRRAAGRAAEGSTGEDSAP